MRNITDIDDKIIEASKKKNKSIQEITEGVTKIFHENCYFEFKTKQRTKSNRAY